MTTTPRKTPLDGPVDDETINEVLYGKSAKVIEAEAAEAAEDEVVVSVIEEDEPYRGAVTGAQDTVRFDNCIVKNRYNRKSLTVHHVQRRLWECGHKDALKDRDGYYGDITIAAVAEFQREQSIEPADGIMTEETFTRLFTGDPIVRVEV